ncbi:MAG: hypothetical protein JXR52_05875 [Bacteroidales bacterium]|nr:hypothetical protein [Bacteroidales bacterium]MBN2698336.1 hypothetical protein [Bacteroidales bacterium]
MHKRIHILIALLALLALPDLLNGQEKITFPMIDALTYGHYLKGNWDSVVHYGKLAQQHGISFYYLDARMGVARYNRKQYLQASRHFREALKKNSGDDFSKEYLYYSYLFSGQNARADLVSRDFSPLLSERIPAFKPRFISSLNPEFVGTFTDAGKLEDQLAGDSADGSRILSDRMAFFQLAVSHQPAAWLTIHQGLSFLQKKNITFVRASGNAVILPDQTFKQIDYYLIPQFHSGTGLSVSPSFHYTGMKYEVLESINSAGYGRNASVTLGTETDRFFLGGMELVQRVWLFCFSAEGSYLLTNLQSDYQQKVGFVFYPLGNLNLYTGLDYYLTGLFQGNPLFENNIWHGVAGWGIRDRVWTEIRYTEGNLSNFREFNNRIFYNSTDFMNRKAQIHLLILRNNNRGHFYLGARWAHHIAPYFLSYEGTNDMNNIFEFNSYTIYGGITWNI